MRTVSYSNQLPYQFHLNGWCWRKKKNVVFPHGSCQSKSACSFQEEDMGSKCPLISKKTMATWNDSDYIRPIIRRSLMWGGLPAEIKSGRGRRSKQLMSWSTGRRGLASEDDLAEIKFLAPSGAFALRLGGVKDVLLPSTTGGQCASCKGFHHSGTGATPISRDCCHRVGPDALLWHALSYTAPTLSFTVISFSSHVVLRPQLNKHLKSISHVFRGELWFWSKIMKARKSTFWASIDELWPMC